MTRRECQLIECLISNWSPRDIQEELRLSENAYYVSISRLKSKLQIKRDWTRFTAADWNYELLKSYISCIIKIKKSENGELVLRAIPYSLAPDAITPLPPAS